MILRLAVLVQYWLVTDGWTDDKYRGSITSCGKNKRLRLAMVVGGCLIAWRLDLSGHRLAAILGTTSIVPSSSTLCYYIAVHVVSLHQHQLGLDVRR